MAINWSAVQMFKDNPDTTVEATMLVRPRMKCKKIRVMLSSMPLADMAPPKHMAQMISQIVFIIPAIPRVETREFRASLPVLESHQQAFDIGDNSAIRDPGNLQ